jgi:hypothetical protein
MSKIKTPSEKKKLSLELDRRNMYGESPHASRKNIPRSKATQHQQERKAANQILSLAITKNEPDDLTHIESEIKTRTTIKRLSGFKKSPDKPLAEAVARKQRLNKNA